MTADAGNEAEPNPVLTRQCATDQGTGNRARFWVTSIGWATALLVVGTYSTLVITFLYGEVQAGGYSFDTLVTCFVSAGFWTVLGVIGTSYFSIPLATLAVALIRFVFRLIRRLVVRRRSQLQA